ncbi:MAG: DUF47 family protein [Acidobacteriota bacterium]
MARFSLIPREEKFYSEFLAMAAHIKTGARQLEELVATEPPPLEKVAEIKDTEHQCDFLTHEIIQRLNRTFVTPIDREDIHAMARSLDDVMDAIDSAAALFSMYRIKTVRSGVRELARIITLQTDDIYRAVEKLESRKGVLELCVEINHRENEADQLHQKAVQQLFDEKPDPLELIQWKEILDLLEDATDQGEDVANMMENIVVKHG